MKSIGKKLAVFALVALTTGAAFAAGSKESQSAPSTETGEAGYKDTLVVAIGDEAPDLDPQESNTILYVAEKRPLYNYLCYFDYKTNTYQPELAKSWDIVDDTTVIFHLRDDVRFSNGDKFTAADVDYTFRRALETPKSKSSFFFFDPDNSKIIDDYTYELKMLQPYAQVLDLLATGRGGIVDKAYVEKVGKEYAGHNPVGTGPYKFESWVSGTEIRYTANEYYWREQPKTKNLVFRIIPEAANRVIELETGNADAAFDIAGSDIARVESTKGIHIAMGPSNQYSTLTFSMKDPVTSNQDVRYALSYATDRKSLVEAVYGDAAVPATGYMPAITFSYRDYGEFPYDVEKAKEYLAKAGYPNGLTLKFLYNSTDLERQAAEIIQNQWKKIGVDLDLYEMTPAAYLAQGNTFQVAMRNGNASEPSNILIIYDSAFADRLQGNDDWLDAQLAEAKTIYDDGKRAEKYGEIQDYLHEKQYTAPLSFNNVIYGLSDKVEGWDVHPNRTPELQLVSVRK